MQASNRHHRIPRLQTVSRSCVKSPFANGKNRPWVNPHLFRHLDCACKHGESSFGFANANGEPTFACASSNGGFPFARSRSSHVCSSPLGLCSEFTRFGSARAFAGTPVGLTSLIS